ncbi:hypothetical protein R3P38DRAFT_3260686 [Favolaschia claudopus]|uniref:BTB domain-containing protein n=1 Tax=Favolaschia claudopus TaxID=2862362 RepID=A0AAW0CWX8_9AGAR
MSIAEHESLHRVEELWFPGATLVFQAESSLYRVYSGILSAQSSVFRDMLTFPQPADDDSKGDTFDGCPKIVLHDKVGDVTAFFRAIFDCSFFIPPFTTSPPLATLSGILRLSHKYDVPHLRERCLLHLSSLYPTTLPAYDALNYAPSILNLRPPPQTYPPLALLALLDEMHHADMPAPWLIPCIMYLAACNPIDRILSCAAELGDDSSSSSTNANALTATKRALLSAYPKLTSSIHTSILSFLHTPPSPSCLSPAKCTSELLQLGHFVSSSWSKCHFPLEIWEEGDWEPIEGDLCVVCIREARKMHKKARETFWKGLPGLFGVGGGEGGGWEELEKMREALGRKI